MKFRIAFAAAASIALAACGSTDDASTEAEADTVEIPADDAMAGVEEAPVADPDANAVDAETGEDTAAEAEQIEEAGDAAAATAEAAADAMADDQGE